MIIRLEKGQTYEDALNSIKKVLDENASEYKYLLSSTNLYINLCDENGEKYPGNNITISIDTDGNMDNEEEQINNAIQNLIDGVNLSYSTNARDYEEISHKIELDEKFVNDVSNDADKRAKRNKLMEKRIEERNQIEPHYKQISAIAREIDCSRYIPYTTLNKQDNLILTILVSLVVYIDDEIYTVSKEYIPKQKKKMPLSIKKGITNNVSDSIDTVKSRLLELRNL